MTRTFTLYLVNDLPHTIWVSLAGKGLKVQIQVHRKSPDNGLPPIPSGRGFSLPVTTSNLPPIKDGKKAAEHFDVEPVDLRLPLEVTYRIRDNSDILIELKYNVQKLN